MLLCYDMLHKIVFYHIMPDCTTLHYSMLYHIMHYTIYHYIVLYFSSLTYFLPLLNIYFKDIARP